MGRKTSLSKLSVKKDSQVRSSLQNSCLIQPSPLLDSYLQDVQAKSDTHLKKNMNMFKVTGRKDLRTCVGDFSKLLDLRSREENILDKADKHLGENTGQRILTE